MTPLKKVAIVQYIEGWDKGPHHNMWYVSRRPRIGGAHEYLLADGRWNNKMGVTGGCTEGHHECGYMQTQAEAVARVQQWCPDVQVVFERSKA